MAVNETTTVVEEYEYSEDGYLLKKTTTTTTRAAQPVHAKGVYPWGGQFVTSDKGYSYLNGTVASRVFH